METDKVKVKANYWRHASACATFAVVVSAPVFLGALPRPLFAWFVALVLAAVLLALTFVLTTLLGSLVLTPEGFSEPFGVYRLFWHWSDVGPFRVVDERFLGMRVQGVGFNYLNANERLRRRRKWGLGCDRVITHNYYTEPAELARLLNRWRDAYLGENAPDGRVHQD